MSRALLDAIERYETAEHLAAERLKGLQGQERQIKDLKRELLREKAINDALTEANGNGRQSLIKSQQRLHEYDSSRVKLLDRIATKNVEIRELKDTIDCQDEDLAQLRKQLEEAREAAARADKTAEDLYQDLLSHKDCAEKRYMRICKLEQQIQAQNNTISMLDSRIERMNVAIREKDQEIHEFKDTIDCQDEDLKQIRAQREQQRLSEEMRSRHIEHLEQCNENQRRLIQTLREWSASALIQRIRDDMAKVEKYQYKVSFDHLRQILDSYERQGFGDEQ